MHVIDPQKNYAHHSDFKYVQCSSTSFALLNICLTAPSFSVFFKENHENGDFLFFVEAGQCNTALLCMQSLKKTGKTSVNSPTHTHRVRIISDHHDGTHSRRSVFLNPKSFYIRRNLQVSEVLSNGWFCDGQQKVKRNAVF